jgi:simple sugar transport system substrate-binding protein
MRKQYFMILASGIIITFFASAGPAGEPLRFVFITCCRDEAFFDPVKKGMAEAARAMNVRCEFTGTEGVDLKTQADMVRKAVADRYDGIALNIIDPEAFGRVIAEAREKGVPVVAFNTDAASPQERSAEGRRPAKNRLSAV